MSDVRVRVAPSPTGDPHVGTAYMALFNYAFAKSRGGQFLLRIEDTDQSRSRPEYEQAIFEALRWLGLDWDEGPDVGGPHGPYRQSERTALYTEHAAQLVRRGEAYPCFCTPERLARVRAEQSESGRFGYDGHCRGLPPEEVAERVAAGESHVIRLAVPAEGNVAFNDYKRGTIEIDVAEVDDQVLIKTDGHPTYHLAVVVDDHEMRISHVIRGEEWIPSTPKHVLLYRAFGWDEPVWVHMPLLRNPDKSKLSKRKNPTSVGFYRRSGYLPEALVNFLGLMGYSPPEGDEKFDLPAFVAGFDLDQIQLGGPVWDTDKLRHFNARYIREDHTPEQLYDRLEAWQLGREAMAALVPMMQPRLETLADFVPKVAFMLSGDVGVSEEALLSKGLDVADATKLIQCFLWDMQASDAWDRDSTQAVVESVAQYCDRPVRDLTHLLFVSLTGGPVGPPIYDVIELMGKELARYRLRCATDALGGLGKKKLKKLEKFWQSNRGN